MSTEPVKQPAPSKDADRPSPAPPMRTVASYGRRDVRNIVARIREGRP